MIIIQIAQFLLRPLDRISNWFFGSKNNPLHQTGAIIVSLLILMILTGFYLLIDYRLGAPYESMQAIDSQVFLGRWLRTVHRYASDLAVVFLILHVLRMIAEQKTFGARLLAWMTGVFLAGIMYIIGWTGFVLIWDQHAQALALAGAEMLNKIPLFSDIIIRTFSGATSIGSSFFFLNLFLHMSLPLGMVFGLWLHLSNLRNPLWLLSKKNFAVLTVALIGISLAIPAPLAPSADLLAVGGSYPLNLFYGHLIPLVKYFSSGPALLIIIGVFLLILFVPYYVRPQNLPEKSKHNPLACTGCEQCVSDCPFDAIEMINRAQGEGSKTVASVIENSCVGCGICSGSCSQLAIGPAGKSSKEQIQWIKSLKQKSISTDLLFVYCRCNLLGPQIEKQLESDQIRFASLAVDCAGIIHVSAIFYALQHFKAVSIIGCGGNSCQNRLGSELLQERFLNGRDPMPPGSMEFDRIHIASAGSPDFENTYHDLSQLLKKLNLAQIKEKKKSSAQIQFIKFFIGSALGLSAVAFLSALQYRDQSDQSYLRISIRLPGQADETCRDRTAEELQKLPQHMRTVRICERVAVEYRFRTTIDGKLQSEELIHAHGARSDKPLIVDQRIPLSIGQHQVSVEFNPTQQTQTALSLSTSFQEDFEKDRAILVYYDANEKKLAVTKKQLK